MPTPRARFAPSSTSACRSVLFAALVLGAPRLFAASVGAPANPFEIVDRANALRKEMSASTLRDELARRIANAAADGAAGYLFVAELMRQIGDPRAGDYYRRASVAASDDAAYELLYADYLRLFRGPGRPLFEDAETAYLSALERLGRPTAPLPWSTEVRERALRGLVALYQEDGVPIAWRDGTAPRPPYAFLSTVARTARSTSDLDESHDIRDLTAEALFAASALRLHRPLSFEELRGLVRRKEPALLSERLRFRFEGAALDLLWESRGIREGQVTSFRRDRSSEGLSAFENDRIGVGLDLKLYAMRSGGPVSTPSARFSATTILLGCRYSRERFPRLDKRVNLTEFSVSLGY